MSATQDLKENHIIVRRFGSIAQKCSNKLSANEPIPLEDIKIISVIIEEFVDSFHHGKEEKVYFPETEDRDNFAEDIRKFLIEQNWKEDCQNVKLTFGFMAKATDSREPVARFLKSYAIFIADHLRKGRQILDLVEENRHTI
jgi:hemerythrin-like domain-containing protein